MSTAADSSKSQDLLEVVQEKGAELGVELKTSSFEEELTAAESLRIERTSFPSELQFSVPVNLSLSKKAFQCVVSGLDSSCVAGFDKILQLRAHDVRQDYYPMGPVELDLSFLLGEGQA